LVMGSRLEKAMVESVIDSLSQSLLNYISAENRTFKSVLDILLLPSELFQSVAKRAAHCTPQS
jgi:hypothetical protein